MARKRAAGRSTGERPAHPSAKRLADPPPAKQRGAGAATVAEYIRTAPVDARPVLRKLAAAVRATARGAEESISYGMPFYSFRGETGVEGRLCYFTLQRGEVRVYFRPRDLEPYADDVARYRSSSSALHFSLESPIPLELIRRIVEGAVRRHAAQAKA